MDARGDLLYVALSTADKLAVVDLVSATPRRLKELSICAFPDALAALPGGGVVVSCRFDPALRVVSRGESPSGRESFRVRAVDAGPEHGHRDLTLDPSGHLAYVSSPARGGVTIVDLWAGNVASRFVPTGTFPASVTFVPAAASPAGRPLLLVANFVGHTVGVYAVGPDGGLGPLLQTVTTAAPVRDMAVVPAPGGGVDGLAGLVLATHEDRPLSREHLAVEGLDSVLLVLPFGPAGSAKPFLDPGAGRRRTLNLCEGAVEPMVSLDALAVDPIRGRVAVAGAGSDNVLVASAGASALAKARAVAVGGNPSAVAFLPDGRVATADRLSDSVSIVDTREDGAPVVTTVIVGRPERPTPAERGELLFYSRALVPHNVAAGALSLYTCAACHADGHIDGRRHPSKRNRFYSMTKSCRGLAGTEPFLSLGQPDTFAAFADNIVATHAQGALDAPETYDRYPVALRSRVGDSWTIATLTPAEVRVALAQYMARIPLEPSPFSRGPGAHFSEVEQRGLDLFRGNCSGCHQLRASTNGGRPVPAAAQPRQLRAGRLVLTSARRYDVGTPVLGEGGNNPPSLRDTWAAAPYFSDGSAPTLEAVVRRTDPKAPRVHGAENLDHPPAFTPDEQAALVAFLRGL